MPVPRLRISEAEERLNLLEDIHTYFSHCLPTLDDIRNGRFSISSGDTLINLDAVTLLRTDIRYLPITLQYINIEQAARDNNIDRLIRAFDSLLALFEESVQMEETLDESVTIQQVGHVYKSSHALVDNRKTQAKDHHNVSVAALVSSFLANFKKLLGYRVFP